MLDVLRPVNREGVGGGQGETKCMPTTSTMSDSLRNTRSILEDGRNLGEMKFNEPGKQKLDNYVDL